jgi:hypothetical protein
MLPFLHLFVKFLIHRIEDGLNPFGKGTRLVSTPERGLGSVIHLIENVLNPFGKGTGLVSNTERGLGSVMVIMVIVVIVVIVVEVLMIIIVMLAMVIPISVTLPLSVVAPMEHHWALVMAFVIARCASLVASMGFQHHGALCLCLPDGPLRIVSKLLVHPVSFKFGALATLCILARCMASLDRWEVLARFYEWSPWLLALGVACDIFAALMMACMSFLHLVVHFLVPRLLIFTTMVPILVVIVWSMVVMGAMSELHQPLCWFTVWSMVAMVIMPWSMMVVWMHAITWMEAHRQE